MTPLDEIIETVDRETFRVVDEVLTGLESIAEIVVRAFFRGGEVGDALRFQLAIGKILQAPSMIGQIPSRIVGSLLVQLLEGLFRDARFNLKTKLVRGDLAFKEAVATLADVISDIQAFILVQALSVRGAAVFERLGKYRSRGLLTVDTVLKLVVPPLILVAIKSIVGGLASTALSIASAVLALFAFAFGVVGLLVWLMFIVYWLEKVSVDLVLFQGVDRRRLLLKPGQLPGIGGNTIRRRIPGGSRP